MVLGTDLNSITSIEDIELSSGAIALYQRHRIINANSNFASIFGYNPGELSGKYLTELFTLDSYNKYIKNCIYGNETINKCDCRKKDSQIINCYIGNQLISINGKSIGILTAKLIESKEKLHETKKLDKYSALFENSIDGIYMCTLQGKFLDANPSFIRMMGLKSKKELLDKKVPEQLIGSINEAKIEEYIEPVFFETILELDGGTEIEVEVSSSLIFEKATPGYIQSIVRDVTLRRRNEEKIKYLSYHDSLTRLYNRAFFEEELKRLNSSRNIPLSIIMGDVSGLKIINDTFGHSDGDRLLIDSAIAFKKCCRQGDIISRWGGDEFAILLPNTTEEQAVNIINRVKSYCKDYLSEKINLNISLGASTKNDITEDIQMVIKEAEDNMYTNKLIESETISNSIFSSLKRMLYEKSIETETHAERLKEMALKLGKEVKLPRRKLDELSLLASLHDIGKIAISEDILKKKEKLTEQEWEIIRKHPLTGYRIVLSCPQLSLISKGILYHHERWDGKGYPHCIKGEEIPIVARIISIVDAYDVMVNGRPYKKKMPKRSAVKELKKCAGTQFDPEMVQIFISII